MNDIHTLLKDQLRQYFDGLESIPKEWQGFIEAVNNAYWQSDVDRDKLEGSPKLISEELRQANAEMGAFFQAVPVLFFRLDNKGTILEQKGGPTTGFGIPPENLIGKRIYDLPFDKAGSRFLEAIHNVRETKAEVIIDYSMWIEGQKNFFKTRLLPFPKDQIIAIVRNITERKQAEQKIQNLQRYNPSYGEKSRRIDRDSIC